MAAAKEASAGTRATPEAAMRSFIVSVWTLDREAFLAHFSKSKPHYVSSYIDGTNRSPVTFDTLAKDVRARTGLYCDYMLDCGNLDVFADQIVSDREDGPAGPAMWAKDGPNRFRPKGGGKPVTWRKEGAAWVVDEIGLWGDPEEAR
jgi:hypothetical protein